MAFASDVTITLGATLTGALDIEAVTSQIARSWKTSWLDGTGANQANNLWSDTRTLSSGSSENLDLAGSLANALGATLTFTGIKGLLIAASASNTTNLTVGNVTNGITGFLGAATHSILLHPGSMFLITSPAAAGYGVTASTADLIKIANAAGASASYDIAIWGNT